MRSFKVYFIGLVVFLASSAFAQTTTPPRQTRISQTGTNAVAPVLDGTQPFTVTPNRNNTLTVTQGATTKLFPNSNALTVRYTGTWPKCPPKPPIATRIVQCPAGTQGTWTQTQDWASVDYPVCWVIQPWLPTSPPAGSCPPIANQPPVANFAFSVNGLQVNFVDTSTDADGTIVIRSWNFGDGGTATISNPAHAYAQNGTYNVTLTVTDNGGATNTKTQQVTTTGVVPPPGNLVLDLSYVDRSGAAYSRFKQYVDRAVGGSFDYLFSATDAAYMAKLDGAPQYCALAKQLSEQQVSAAEAAIANGQNPSVAGDSYLGVGSAISSLALTYAWCNSTLTDAQKGRWKAYADQAIFNVWHPAQASWGGRPASWSGWAVNDPANNYYYSFMKATEFWALAKNNTDLIAFLRNDRWPLLTNFYATIPGGGSLEGTGYGVSHKDLFELYQVWHDSGQGDLANANQHMTNSGLFWLHATVPTREKFVPFGDQSRVSEPVIYDYQRTLGLQVYHQTNNPAAASDVAWWLAHISDQNMQNSFNYRYNLIPVGASPTNPSALTYRAPEVGAVFARTSWDTNAVWVAALFGTYNQSHAHQEQGGFTLYKGTWLAVTNNIWSHSGINQSTIDKNIVRFESAGNVLPQRMGHSVNVTSYTAGANGDLHITGNLTPMYQTGVSWTRTLDFVAGVLTVNDDLTLGAGTTATFQLNVPTQPIVSGNIVTTAGLRMTVLSPPTAQISAVDMRTVNVPGYGNDFNSGWRVDVKGSTTNYRVKLEPTN